MLQSQHLQKQDITFLVCNPWGISAGQHWLSKELNNIPIVTKIQNVNLVCVCLCCMYGFSLASLKTLKMDLKIIFYCLVKDYSPLCNPECSHINHWEKKKIFQENYLIFFSYENDDD